MGGRGWRGGVTPGKCIQAEQAKGGQEALLQVPWTGRSVSTMAFRDQEHHFSCWKLLGRGDLPPALGLQFPDSLGKIPGKGLRADQGE